MSLIHKKHTFCKYGVVCPFFSQNGIILRAKICSLNNTILGESKILYSTMTSWKNRDTSSAIVRAVCARICAGRRYGLLMRKKHIYIGSPFFQTIPSHRGGITYIWRAYRLSYESFLFLHEKVSVGIAKAVDDLNYKLPPVRNGLISTSGRLACALRY